MRCTHLLIAKSQNENVFINIVILLNCFEINRC